MTTTLTVSFYRSGALIDSHGVVVTNDGTGLLSASPGTSGDIS